MKTAVLKNRLLDLTERGFNESDWGADSFREFVERFDDVVAIVPEERPLAVRLLVDDRSEVATEGDAGTRPPDPGPRFRIRKDLWDAVLDYSSGTRYAWDGRRAVALDEGASAERTDLLPTLPEEEFQIWRSEFVRAQSSENSTAASFLYVWLEKEQALQMLPSPLRVAWVVELKRRVIERLQAWFRAKGIETPSDLLTDAAPVRGDRGDVEALRELVLAAVRRMNRAELESLRLPATVLLRSKE